MESESNSKKKWVKVYPCYIDKSLKCHEGRKVSSELAIENPTVKEIFFVCAEAMKIDCASEVVEL